MSMNKVKIKESGVGILILGNRCYRCTHEWRPNDINKPPRVCPKCKSPYWDKPKKNGDVK